MNEKERQELEKAIRSLSKEDQMEIAGGKKITDAQCDEIKAKSPLVIAYGCPLPKEMQIPIEDVLKQFHQEVEDDKPKENNEL